jgi:anti-sigma28 factor (negative regulator of flagellin synthesis)
MAYYNPYPRGFIWPSANTGLRFHNAPPGYGNGNYFVVEPEQQRHHSHRRREEERAQMAPEDFMKLVEENRKLMEENRKLKEKVAALKGEVEGLKAEKVALGVELEELKARERAEGAAWDAWVRGE